MKTTQRHALAFGLYLIFFGVLFLQFPLKNALWGNYDAWVAVMLWKSQLARLESLFTGEFMGAYFFPAQHPSFYGETVLGTSGLFGLFKLAGFSDLWASHGMITLFFTGSAWGVYMAAGHYVRGAGAAFFAGFAYSCSNMMFAVMDETPLVCFLLPGLALHFLLKFISSRDPGHLKWMAVVGGLQVYVSVYTFVLQSLMLLVFALVHIKAWAAARNLARMLASFLWCGLMALPLFLFHIYGKMHGDIYFPWPVHLVMDGTILHFFSLFGVLPNNLLYPEAQSGLIFWGHLRTLAFLGFGAWALALIGLSRETGRKLDLLVLGLAGAAFSFAVKTLELGPASYDLPFYYTGGDSLLNFFRVPSRFFWLTSLAVSILAACGLERLSDRLPKKKWAVLLVACALGLHFVENTPFPLRAYPFEPFGVIPKEYKEYFAGKQGQVILNLPSTDIAIVPFTDDDLFGFNRELVYMNWQTEHRQHTINGVNSYTPSFRMLFEKMVDRVFYEDHAEDFPELQKYGLTHVVFCPELVLEKDEGLADRVANMPFLRLAVDSPRARIYEVIPE